METKHTCTQSELIKEVSKKNDLSYKKVKQVIESYQELLEEKIIIGKDTKIRGFGTFKLIKSNFKNKLSSMEKYSEYYHLSFTPSRLFNNRLSKVHRKK